MTELELAEQSRQHQAAVEALIWVFEERPGWRTKVAWAVRQQPQAMLEQLAAQGKESGDVSPKISLSKTPPF